MPQEQFTPTLVSDVDVPIMVGGDTAIFYAYWEKNRSPGRPPLDRAKLRQRPEFICRSVFDVFTVVLDGPLPPGVALETVMGTRSAYFDFTTSELAVQGEPYRLTATVTCTTYGHSEVKPTFWAKDRAEEPILPEDRAIPYANYWTGTTVVFQVPVIIHTKDEPWLTGPDGASSQHGWFGDLNMVCEAGRYVAKDYNPQTTLRWEAGYEPGCCPGFFILLSEIQVGAGAHPREHDYALWINKSIFMLDEHGEMDLNRPSGLYVRFPGVGENPWALTGLSAQGPVTIWGTPREVGNTAVEVRMLFDASYSYKAFQGWESHGTWKDVTIPITILEKFAPPGRAVILHKAASHVEDRLWMSTQDDELSSNTLAGSWYPEGTSEGDAPLPGGGLPAVPVPPPPRGPFPPPAPSVGTVTEGSPIITGITTASDLKVGGTVVGEGIPDGAYIIRITDPTSVVLNVNVTESGTVLLEFGPPVGGTGAGTPPAPDYSTEEPENRVILTDVTSSPGYYLSLIPGPFVYPSYGPTGGSPSRSITVPDVLVDHTVDLPLATEPYAVGEGIPYPVVNQGDTGARSAFMYPYLFNPTEDKLVPGVLVDYTVDLPLALAPYPVGFLPESSFPGAEPAILSAFMYPYVYNPTPEKLVPDVLVDFEPTWPFNRVEVELSLTGDPDILSSFSWRYPYNPASEVDVPAPELPELFGFLPFQLEEYLLSAFMYPYYYNPSAEVQVPDVSCDIPTSLYGLEAQTGVGKPILSAFGWPYAYSPAVEVNVPSAEVDRTVDLPLALSPYFVGVGVPETFQVAGDPGILSAFSWRYPYNPADEVHIPALIDRVGSITIKSAFGYPYPYNPALEVLVPYVTDELTPPYVEPEPEPEPLPDPEPLNNDPIASAFGWMYPYTPVDEVEAPAVELTATTPTPLATAPYAVGVGLPQNFYQAGCPALLSAFGYPHAYPAQLDIEVPDPIIDTTPNSRTPLVAA